MLQPGSQIGRYEIQRKLARGGMGTVYVAHDPVLGRMVAVKVFLGDLDVPDAAERFSREARAAAALNHANIVTIYDFGDVDSQPYIVMEYIQGETLAEFITRKTAVPLTEKLRWLEELCAGVCSAHKMEVVHRDIKPSNLMIDRSGRLKILDFGIAKLLNSLGSSVTAVIGTPGYMAPEQLLGQPVDGRTDIFSIGVVAFELLTYQEAFAGDSFTAITHRIINEDVRHLSELLPEAPRELCDLVARSVQKDPARRFQDAESMRIILSRIRRKLESSLEVESQSATTVISPVLLPKRPPSGGATAPASGPARGQVRTAELTPPPNPATQREALARARASQIAAALERAEVCLRDGELDAARAACAQAQALDPGHAALPHLERRIQEAQARFEAAQLLENARNELARGALTTCRSLLEQARELDPQARDPHLERDLRLARAEQERRRHRAEAVARTLASAREALGEGDDEAALAWAREALTLAPDSEEARALEQQALTRLQALTERGGDGAPPAPVPATAREALYEDPPTIVASMPRPAPAPPPPSAPVTAVPPRAAQPRRAAPVDEPPLDDAPTMVAALPERPVLPDKPAARAPATPTAAPPSGAVPGSRAHKDVLTRAREGLGSVGAALGPLAARLGQATASVQARVRHSSKRQRMMVAGVLAAGLLITIAVAAWLLRPPAATAAPGQLVIEAIPWARVVAIRGADGANMLAGPDVTPMSQRVPAGSYTVELVGPSGERRSVTMQVTANGMAVAPATSFEVKSSQQYFDQYFGSGAPAPAPEDAAPNDSPITDGASGPAEAPQVSPPGVTP